MISSSTAIATSETIASASRRSASASKHRPRDNHVTRRRDERQRRRRSTAVAGTAWRRPARHQRRQDQHRLEPFAEDNHRAVRRHAPASPPGAAALRRVVELGIERGGGRFDLRVRAFRSRSGQAVVIAFAVPEQPFDPPDDGGAKPAQRRPGRTRRPHTPRAGPAPAARTPGGGSVLERVSVAQITSKSAPACVAPGLGEESVCSDERDRLLRRPLHGLGRRDVAAARRRASRSSPTAAGSAVSSRRAAAARSRRRRAGSRSAKAAAAPFRKLIASWSSKSSVTRPSSTPRSYSIGTSARNGGSGRPGVPPRRGRAALPGIRPGCGRRRPWPRPTSRCRRRARQRASRAKAAVARRRVRRAPCCAS